MYSDVITVFNRYHSRLGDMWFPHVIHDVDLQVDKAAILAKYGAESKDSAILHIRFENGVNGQIMVDGKPYLPPKEWAELTNDQLGNYITFNEDAENFDFFIAGVFDGEGAISDDDFTEGFYDYMNMSKDFCFAVSSVSKHKLIPHFEIMGR